jgi:hypothetical protein
MDDAPANRRHRPGSERVRAMIDHNLLVWLMSAGGALFGAFFAVLMFGNKNPD